VGIHSEAESLLRTARHSSPAAAINYFDLGACAKNALFANAITHRQEIKPCLLLRVTSPSQTPTPHIE
jgi:hypothetical protein